MNLNVLLKCLFSGWLLFSTFWAAAAQGNKPRGCGESCFETQIQNISEISGGCLKYTLLITNNGNCAHALSHYTVGVPCGTISEVSNTGGWKQEVGITDPTTGLTGFKVDDISGFGEDGAAGNFTVEFTVCTGPDNSCSTDLDCWAPKVAYKAGQCVYYEETEVSCSTLSAQVETQDVSCFGGNDGSAAVIIETGAAPFTYAWSNNKTEAINSNIEAGEYTITVTDATGESVILTAVINQPAAMEASLDVISASCSGTDDGSAGVSVTGGVPPYSYMWSTGATGDHVENLGAGYYELTISDSQGCSIEVPFMIESLVTINITGVVEETACNANSGSVDVTVSGGTSPYVFVWSNAAGSEDINALGRGMYSITVTDANGCEASRSFLVNEVNPLRLNATATKTSCVENSSGSIDLTVANGLAPYTYVWSNGASTEDISGLAQGLYTVDVTDQNGCEASLRVSIVSETFQVGSNTKNPSCHGATDGLIQLTPSSDPTSYSYSWSTGSTAQNLENLAGGLYDVMVTDANGCSRKLYFFLSDPLAITASATISNSNCVAGQFNVDLTVTGGTGPYSYTWSDGSTAEDPANVVSGSYTVDITDANGCAVTETFLVDASTAGCTEVTDPDEDSTDDNVDDGTEDGGSDDDGSDEDPGDGGDPGDDEDGDNTDDEGDENTDEDDDSGNTDDGENDEENPDGQTGNDRACSDPFDTEIELVSVDGNCYSYTASVSYHGDHSFGLSHYSVAVPCGTIGEITNSGSWKVEVGEDPTTGISGFKIDDINNFGEGDWQEEFSVNFTVCATDEACSDILSDMDYTVAYKYGQCVDSETVATSGDPAVSLLAYPNPFSESTTIEFSNLPEGYTTVNIYNHFGQLVKQLFAGVTKKGVVYSLPLDGSDLPNDTYMYKINTPSQVYSGKIMLIKR